MSNLQDDRAAAEAQREKADQAEVVYNWRVKHPEYSYDACIAALKEYHHGELMTETSLDESAERLLEQGVIQKLPAKTKEDFIEEDKQQRDDTIDWIMSNRTWASQESKESEFARLSRIESNIPIVSTETLKNIRQNIENKRRLDKLSLPELKAEARQDEARFLASRGIRDSQWQPVPQYYQNKSILKSLPADEFRNLMRRCGRDQLNEILQAPDKN